MIRKLINLAEKIPGFSLAAIAAKEINLIKTQKIALALILLYPIIVILTLGTAFSGTNTIGKIDVAFYITQNDPELDAEKFVERLEKSQSINLIPAQSEEDVYKYVNDRKAKIGIIVHEREPTQGRFIVDVINDNSNIVSSAFFFQATNESIRSVGFQTTAELLAEVWSNLSKIKSDLRIELDRVNDFTDQLDKSEAELIDLNNQINNIDIAQMRSKLESQEQIIEEIGPKIEQFQEKITKFKNFKQTNLTKIGEIKEKIDSYKSQISSQKTAAKKASDYCKSPEGQAAGAANTDFRNACDQISELVLTLDDAESELESTSQYLDQAQSDFSDISGDLESASADLESIKTSIEASNNDLNFFNSQLSTLSETVDKVNFLITDSLERKNTIQSQLKDSSTLIDGFIDKLAELDSLSPQFLSNPIIINKISRYKISKLEAVTPTALVLVIMLTTILLTGVSFIVERTEGSYSRLMLSSTSKLELFVGKILGQMIFALMEATIILAIAIFGFGVKLNGSLVDLYLGISIVSFSFIALGLFITNYTKIQSTTILGGLLLVIPMLFISGIMMPIELMSEPIQQMSKYQPLSLGSLIISEIIIKGTSLLTLGNELVTLLIPAIILIIFTLYNRNL